MRVVIISVASVNEPHRAAYDLLARDPAWEVDIVAPEAIPLPALGRSQRCDPAPHGASYRLHALPIRFPRSGRFIWFSGLSSLLRRLEPDVVFVEQDPGSLAVLATWALAHDAKRIAFTVENIHHRRFDDARKALFAFRARAAIRDATVGVLSAMGAAATTGLACISKEGLRLFRDEMRWKKPIGLVPLGTDTNRFRPMEVSARRRELNLEDSFVVGYFGRLVPEKGVHLVLEALVKTSPKTKLLLDMFFEPGSFAATVMDRAADLGVKERIVTIDVPHAEVATYMNCCDTVVLPSLTTERWKEQFGRVLPEAMACGVPVIGSTSGNIPDMIGDAGIVVDEGSADAIAVAIGRLQDDPGLRDRLAIAGRERVIRLFSVEAQVEGMKQLFVADA